MCNTKLGVNRKLSVLFSFLSKLAEYARYINDKKAAQTELLSKTIYTFACGLILTSVTDIEFVLLAKRRPIPSFGLMSL